MLSYSLQSGKEAVIFKPVFGEFFPNLAKIISRYNWAPAIYENNYRKKANFKAANLCVLDFDDGQTSLDEAINNLFCDYRHIIGTTRNHQKDKGGLVCDRFRVVLAFERPITCLAQWESNLKRFYENYTVDTTTKEGARQFFPCSKIVSVETEGYEVEVLRLDENERSWKGNKTAIAPPGKKIPLPFYVIHELGERTWQQGKERNNRCFGLSKDLARCGYTRDEALQMILDSPTYSDMPEPSIPLSEIKQAIHNGFRAENR